MAEHMLLTNGSIRGPDYRFRTFDGPFCDEDGKKWCRIEVVEGADHPDNFPVATIEVYYDRDGEPFATYQRLVNAYKRHQDRPRYGY